MPDSLAMFSRIAPMLSYLITVLFSEAKVGELFLSVNTASRRRLRKARIVPLLEAQVCILKRYMDENKLFENHRLKHPLFFNLRNEKMTRQGVTYILHTYANLARKEHPELIPDTICCHSLRHSKAMHLLQAGVNIIYVRDLLGHVSIQSTDVYARADSKAKREAIEKAYTDIVPEEAKTREWKKNQTLLDWLKNL